MTIRDIDYDLRKLNSLLLRIVLIIVLVIILFYNKNYFSEWAYILVISIYTGLMILNVLFVKIKYKGIIRLILDLTIIGFFLYQKDLNHILNYLPFLIMLFNVQSHSNKNDKILLFVILTHLSILFIDDFSFKLTNHIIPVIFYLFIFIQNVRKLFASINEEIILLVGDLFIENVSESNSHRILRDVIDKINDSKVKIINQIDELFLFINYKGKFVLIKGSKFIINYEIKSDKGIDVVIKSNPSKNSIKTISDIVIIDGVKYGKCYWLNHKVLDKDYYFLVSLKRDSIFNEYLIRNFRPIFEYIARVYYISNSLIELNNSNTKIIKQKIAYVFDAQNALHFVKNKLSPITSTIDLMDRYFKQKDITKEQKEYIEKRLLQNNNNAEIKTIIKKAEVLIKGVDNILNEEDKIISLRSFIDDLRKNWLFHFNNIDEVIIDVENLNNIYVLTNQMMFDFVFTDIIENISKYGGSNIKKVLLTVEDKFVNILFSNKIGEYEKFKQELDEIVSLYNLRDNDEIYSRKTHGLNFIRRLLRRKNIENKIFVDKVDFTFNYEIKICKHENIGV